MKRFIHCKSEDVKIHHIDQYDIYEWPYQSVVYYAHDLDNELGSYDTFEEAYRSILPRSSESNREDTPHKDIKSKKLYWYSGSYFVNDNRSSYTSYIDKIGPVSAVSRKQAASNLRYLLAKHEFGQYMTVHTKNMYLSKIQIIDKNIIEGAII